MTVIDLNLIIQLAKEAGNILKTEYALPHKIQRKGVQDIVTEVDKASETFILRRLAEIAPDHTILSEESGWHGQASDHTWYIDPLDGTMNFAHDIPFFCVSIAYAYQGEMRLGVIYDPLRDECFSAEKGHGAFLNNQPICVRTESNLADALLATSFNINTLPDGRSNLPLFAEFLRVSAGVRRMGSSALTACYTACGRLDGYWALKLSAWDVAASFLIAAEAGARITQLNGEAQAFTPPYEFVMANPSLHKLMIEKIRKCY